MNYRKLRIAWSVGWGFICLLLIVLWVRSYSVYDRAYAPRFGVLSDNGGVRLWVGTSPQINGWAFRSDRVSFDRSPKLYYFANQDFAEIAIPYWLLLMMPLAISAVTWLPWRFSLRTLLIATTLVAVLLGIVIWAAK